VYDNWLEYLAGKPPLGGSEHVIYTDAGITGDLSTGIEPYALINLVPLEEVPGRVRPALVLRWFVHLAYELPSFEKTDSSRYHGGDVIDEIAALASLKCGIRLMAGGQVRRFDIGGDPKGRPVSWEVRAAPSMDFRHRRLVLPNAAGDHSIMPAEELRSLPSLKPEPAISLVRSARLYQDALWLAETDPHLAWLLLVSAVETAANFWWSGTNSIVEDLNESKPDLFKYLKDVGGDKLVERIAQEFAKASLALKKFREFLLSYMPPPPEKRPPAFAQVDWSRGNLRDALWRIYDHRSKALHEGMRFPAPMCMPPARYEPSWEAREERPMSLGASMGGGIWRGEDLPMHLNTFEYIVRCALNSWWSTMIAETSG
jgi:hypothetical protein